MKTAACPSLPRLRDCLLDPARWTEDERAHQSDCPHCRKTAALMRAELWHPSLLELWKGGSRYVDVHLQRDRCSRCRSAVAWMERLQAPAEEFLRLVRGALSPAHVPSFAGASSYDTDAAEPFFLEVPLEDGKTATLREEPGPEGALFVVTLSSREPVAGPQRLVFLDGEGHAVVDVTLELEPGEEGWFTASRPVAPPAAAGELWAFLL